MIAKKIPRLIHLGLRHKTPLYFQRPVHGLAYYTCKGLESSGFTRVEAFLFQLFCIAPLVRFKCPGCGKTITFYPDFAVPHKHYTRQTVLGFATAYLKTDATYEQAVIVFELRAVINCLHSPGRRPFCFWRNFHQLCINFFV